MEKLSSFKLPSDIKGYFQKVEQLQQIQTQHNKYSVQRNQIHPQHNQIIATQLNPRAKQSICITTKPNTPATQSMRITKQPNSQLNQDPLQSPLSHSRTHHYQRARLNVLCDIFTKDPKELLQSILKAVHYLKELEDKQTGLEYLHNALYLQR